MASSSEESESGDDEPVSRAALYEETESSEAEASSSEESCEEASSSEEEEEAETPPPTKSVLRAVAAYDFEAQDETMLSMEEGDRFRVVEESDDGWWKVQPEEGGEAGYVPSNYLECE